MLMDNIIDEDGTFLKVRFHESLVRQKEWSTLQHKSEEYITSATLANLMFSHIHYTCKCTQYIHSCGWEEKLTERTDYVMPWKSAASGFSSLSAPSLCRHQPPYIFVPFVRACMCRNMSLAVWMILMHTLISQLIPVHVLISIINDETLFHLTLKG